MKRALLLLACVVSILTAQTGTEGSILGIVRDASGAVLPGASVTITNLETDLTKAAITDDNGYFQALGLPRGIYSVTVSMASFRTWQLAKLEITAGEQKRVQPVLAVGDVKQEVTIEGGVELVQTERASVETAIEERQIRELPLNARDPVALVALTPGMRYLGVTQANVQGRQVQGLGQHSDATQFSIDGMDANDPSTEAGMAFPNLEAVEQFRVQSSNFSAENGRDPLQVILITKAGTNQFHGTLWEFLRNDKLDARNAFTHTKPTLRRNQFGFSAGGPIVKNKTFFFTSFEGLKFRGQTIYNSNTIAPAFLQGDFSSLRTPPTDPATGRPFPDNKIPADRFSPASRFFFPYILQPNAPGNLFQALAPNPDDGTNFVLRIDQQLGMKHKIYGRWIRVADSQTNSGYKPDIINTTDLKQHNAALNYNWTISPSMLFTISGGYLHSEFLGNSPLVGKENLTERAGIQGFPTALRSQEIGLPTVAFTGYTGFGYAIQVPSSFKRDIIDGRAGLNIIRGTHTLLVGGEYLDHRTNVHHASADPRGTFTFNSQYTGNGFADYLLGLVQNARANVPLAAFGIAHSPYSALYADDTWRVHPNVTLNLGVRWDHWWEKALIRGGGTTFDTRIGKAVAGENKQHQVDLTVQPVAPFYGAATRNLWVSATQAGLPPGLFESSGYVSPRLGAAWRPFGKDRFVVRGGYGIFAASHFGNANGSSIIGPPYWASQQTTFARASNQRWETAFPADPSNFVSPSIAAPVFNIKPMKIHQFNLSLQQSIPWLQAAVTASYVGSRGRDLTAFPRMNIAPPGAYATQAAMIAAMPYPAFGNINLYQSIGQSWYNGLQLKLEKRYSKGLTYIVSYAFSRDISEFGSETVAFPTPYAPPHYDRGVSPNERRHILTLSGLYELPIRGRLLGGWQLGGLYRFVAGAPLTPVVPGGTLGNGINARPDIVGDPSLDNPSAGLWFNPSAFARPAMYQFGNSAPGSIIGPGLHVLDWSFMKNFKFAEQRYVQFRWEMFNAFNHVNLGAPITTLFQTNTGQILSSGDARQMQVGLKVVF